MKLQGLSVIFGLIVIPMVLVLSYYIQLQVDTITLQTSYDTKLLDATHDAMVAFELNTANEDLSSVADSLRSIIDASNNVFFNTLATNMGLSNANKSYLEPYIPAVLYTLYDGYYINSPTKVPEVAVDSSGVALEIAAKSDDSTKFSIPGLSYNGTEYIYHSSDEIYHDLGEFGIPGAVPEKDYGELLYKKDNGNYTTNINEAKYKNENVLKSYMPYSARYVKDVNGDDVIDIDVTINYTLDNYLTIVGNIGDIYYTKSGYLIAPELVKEVNVNGEDLLHISTTWDEVEINKLYSKYNENDIENKIKSALSSSENNVLVSLKNKFNPSENIIISTNDINSDEAAAIIYYAKAKVFSKWVYSNLGILEECDIVENNSNAIKGTAQKGIEEIVYTFEEKKNKIFDVNQNPEEDSSTFVNHKYQVIRNSIQYNLNLAMSIYNERAIAGYDFNMPIISEDEWEKIINNISIVSFMQGVKCGLKIYNNYAIVSSTNNEITVIPEEIYYVRKDQFDKGDNEDEEIGIYHRIDCPNLEVDKVLTSFVSKEVKYDKIYDKHTSRYQYDHKNLACYTCIVDGNYEPVKLEGDDNRGKAYNIAVAKERNNLYKMNAIKNSEGYKMIYDKTSSNPNLKSGELGTGILANVKSIEITFGHIKTDNFEETTVDVDFGQEGQGKDDVLLYDGIATLITNQSKEQTIILDMEKTKYELAVNNLEASWIIDNDIWYKDYDILDPIHDRIKDAVKSIKVIYK